MTERLCIVPYIEHGMAAQSPRLARCQLPPLGLSPGLSCINGELSSPWLETLRYVDRARSRMVPPRPAKKSKCQTISEAVRSGVTATGESRGGRAGQLALDLSFATSMSAARALLRVREGASSMVTSGAWAHTVVQGTWPDSSCLAGLNLAGLNLAPRGL